MAEAGTNLAYAVQGLYRRIVERHAQYVQRRRQYDAQRNTVVELLRPDLVKGEVGDKDEGGFTTGPIIEGTGPYAALVWQRGFMGNILSRKSDWFRDKVKEPPPATGVKFDGNDEVNQWLQDIDDQMTAAYRRSTYYDVMPQFILDGGTVGSPVMLFQHDIANDRMICQVPDYAAVWLDKDIFGRDNCLHVKREWNALDAAEFFGEEQLPDAIKHQLENGNHYTKTEYLQVIYGAGDRIYKDLPEGESVPQTHPWLEHYICLGAQGPQEEKVMTPLNKGPGYFVRPFSTWHYRRNDHEVYSKAMGWWSIPDIRGNNAMWEAMFGEAEYSLLPATWALGSQRGRLQVFPGGENWAEGARDWEQKPEFLEKPTRPQVAWEFMDRLMGNVRRWFHYDLWLMINQKMDQKAQAETAYGLMRAELERTTQLAPQVEEFENQVLAHTHNIFMEAERTADLDNSWGRLPEPPDIVKEYAEDSDDQITPEFIGPLSMAQNQVRGVEKFYKGVAVAELVAEKAPMTIHKVKWEEALEDALEALDFKQKHIRSAEEYDAVVQGIEQRAMQQQLAEMAPKVAQAAKNLQGETKKGSPLDRVTGAK
jgi:hypothetical protein